MITPSDIAEFLEQKSRHYKLVWEVDDDGNTVDVMLVSNKCMNQEGKVMVATYSDCGVEIHSVGLSRLSIVRRLLEPMKNTREVIEESLKQVQNRTTKLMYLHFVRGHLDVKEKELKK